MSMIKLLGKTNIQGKTIFDTGYSVQDANAAAYIAAVEAADGATLEDPVKIAIENFIVGCKSDGIWNSLKASCILGGARTLNGALVPLVGTAPTNFNFVSADYNRETGLKGNGSTKYLNTNRNNNADPQNSKHLSVYFGENLSSSHSVNRVHLGATSAGGFDQTGASVISTDGNDAIVNSGRYRANGSTAAVFSNGLNAGMKAVTRSNSSTITVRQNSSNTTTSSVSQAPSGEKLFIFARNISSPAYSNARLSFYSIGESLDLAALDTRVSALMTAINAAI